MIAIALVAAAWGCKRQEPDAPAPSKAAAPSEKMAEKPFEVGAKVAGPVTREGTGELVARVVALKGFHINAEYPLSFRPEGSQGLTFEKTRYDLKETVIPTPCADNPKDSCEVTARVPFTATVVGPAKAAGTLSFSVCNPEMCLIEKVPLAANVDVR